MTPATLQSLIALLKDGRPVPRPVDETWAGMVERITAPSRIAEVDEETYWYFLEVLPPRWMGPGGFAFGEGADHLRLFWKAGGMYFCRQLSAGENALFCKLAGIPLTSG